MVGKVPCWKKNCNENGLWCTSFVMKQMKIFCDYQKIHTKGEKTLKKHVKIVKMHDFLKGAKVGSTYFSYLIEYMD